jgi:hypothetical protein
MRRRTCSTSSVESRAFCVTTFATTCARQRARACAHTACPACLKLCTDPTIIRGKRSRRWPKRSGAYPNQSEAVPRIHPRRHLPHENGERKDVGLERHAAILRIRHFATAHATARDPAGTWSCSGDMKAGVPLKPVFDTVSKRFSTRATPAGQARLGHRHCRASSRWTAHQSRRCTFQSNHASL